MAPATVVCYGLLIGITGAPASRGLGVAVLAAWLIGYREQWQRKLQAHEAAKRVAAAEERARIARELHDVVAHSVSVMVVQAEAGRKLVGRDPGATLNALQSISAAGREAMGELRHILGVLNPADGKPLAAPQPGLGDVDALVQRVREAGLAVELRIEGTPHTLPPGLAVTAYRIVQEALTNAVKHSDGGPAEVVIRYGESDLTLEVTNEGWTARRPSPPENGGRGLLGMQERVAAYGGDLEVGPRPGNSYAVRARLPLAS